MLIQRKRVKGCCCSRPQWPTKANSRRLRQEREQRLNEKKKAEKKLLRAKKEHAYETQMDANARQITRRSKLRKKFEKEHPREYWRQEVSKVRKKMIHVDDKNGFSKRLNTLLESHLERFLAQSMRDYLADMNLLLIKLKYDSYVRNIKSCHEEEIIKDKESVYKKTESYLKEAERKEKRSSIIDWISYPFRKYGYWIILGIIAIFLVCKNYL